MADGDPASTEIEGASVACEEQSNADGNMMYVDGVNLDSIIVLAKVITETWTNNSRHDNKNPEHQAFAGRNNLHPALFALVSDHLLQKSQQLIVLHSQSAQLNILQQSCKLLELSMLFSRTCMGIYSSRLGICSCCVDQIFISFFDLEEQSQEGKEKKKDQEEGDSGAKRILYVSPMKDFLR
jgi:hypothetical protein